MKDYLKFSYPIKYTFNWHFNKPSNLDGGWKSWFYRKWTGNNKNETTRWEGKIILGFKKIVVIYICDEQTARKEYVEGMKRVNRFLMDLIKNKNNPDKIKELLS